ncbi:MAG: aspartate kinase [Planctomycetes bacterium]|nr:aspartate kinase [Planctomycetota bacterium]MBI3846295.1 aspartate kinase [Planctomycetota bacterium]
MIVMKFGGTSVGSAGSIRAVVELVRARLRRKPLVVVSALAGVTDALESAARAALRGTISVAAIRRRHVDVLRELDLATTLIDPEFRELDEILRGIQLLGELSPRSLDYVMSFGERLAVRILAAFFVKSGITATAIDAYDLGLVTDSGFGRARPLDRAYDRIAEVVLRERRRGLLIVTGYIGKDERGNVTTLGRNGSDYTAAIIGSSLGVEEIQIWTDVNGVMSADPELIPSARSIAELSFDEASEVAYYGAKVLHPATIQPAVSKNIPVRVLNTHAPTEPGTLIIGRARKSDGPVKAIVCKRGITVVSVVSTRMLMQHGFLAKIFDVFDRQRVVIDLVATSEVSVSCTTDSDENLDAAIRELRGFADARVQGRHAIVAAIGSGIREARDVPARFFGALGRERIGAEMISQGATRTNLSALVRESEVSRAVQALHREFFDDDAACVAAAARPASRRKAPLAGVVRRGRS